jgi:hypothetical protein
MSEDEIAVLNYVACGMGGPDSIMEPLRATYHNLIERGFIRMVVLYELTDHGEKVMEPVYART